MRKVLKTGHTYVVAACFLIVVAIFWQQPAEGQASNPGKTGAKGATGAAGATGPAGATGAAGAGTTFTMTNNTVTGTAADKPVIDDGSGKALVAPAGQTAKILGLCIANCTNSGTATITTAGKYPCAFENGTSVGNYVIPATGTTGCRDSGVSTGFPLSTQGVQTLGVVLSTNGGAGTYDIVLFGPGVTTQFSKGIDLSNGTTGLKPGNNDNIEGYAAAATRWSWSEKGIYIHPTASYASPTGARGPLDIDGGECCNAITGGWPINIVAPSLNQNGNNASVTGADAGAINVIGGQGGGFASAAGSTGGKGSPINITGGQGGNGRTGPDSANGDGGDITLSGGPPGANGPAGGNYGRIILQNLPTTCTAMPTGTLAVVATVLTICP